MEQKVAESESKIANLEEEVQDLKKSAKHPLQDVPELESMLKDIKTSLVLNGGGTSTANFEVATSLNNRTSPFISQVFIVAKCINDMGSMRLVSTT